MAETTGISWCDATFNPWMGCTKVSPACAHCYAEREMDHRYHRVKWGPQGTRVRTSKGNWGKPKRWNLLAGEGKCIGCAGTGSRKSRPCEVCSGTGGLEHRPRVFCASLADVFEAWDKPIVMADGAKLFSQSRLVKDGKPGEWETRAATLDDLRSDLFKLIDATPNLDWLLLTKRPENVSRMWCSHVNTDGLPPSELPRKNVWLGTTVENQEQADKRIPELLKCRHLAPVLFLSCEPLIGPINLHYPLCKHAIPGHSEQTYATPCDPSGLIDWVISGGESGANARPSHPDWFRSLRDQCAASGVAFHHKQNGEWQDASSRDDVPHAAVLNTGDYCTPDTREARHTLDRKVSGKWNQLRPVCMSRVGVKKAGRLLDGVLHEAFPVVSREVVSDELDA